MLNRNSIDEDSKLEMELPDESIGVEPFKVFLVTGLESDSIANNFNTNK